MILKIIRLALFQCSDCLYGRHGSCQSGCGCCH